MPTEWHPSTSSHLHFRLSTGSRRPLISGSLTSSLLQKLPVLRRRMALRICSALLTTLHGAFSPGSFDLFDSFQHWSRSSSGVVPAPDSFQLRIRSSSRLVLALDSFYLDSGIPTSLTLLRSRFSY